MKLNLLKVLGITLVVMVGLSGNAQASGSDGSGSLQTDDTRLYNMGKGVYMSKLACKTCPLAGKSLNSDVANMLLSAKSQPVALSAVEQQALTVYLTRRFKR
jgi:hypothetical protein